MKLRPLGISRKQETEAAKPSDPEKNGKEYPEMNLYGALAEKMGAGDLEVGKRFKQTIEWEVKSLSKTQHGDEEPTYSMTLCAVKGSAIENTDDEDEGGDEEEEDTEKEESEEPTPALDYIERKAGKY